MSFGEWRAHVDPRADFGRHAVLSIAREVSPGEYEVVTNLDHDNGATVQRLSVEEGTAIGSGVRIPLFMAEAIYQALHRVYGQEHQDGKVEALEEALNKERARVDFVLEQAFKPRHQVVAN